MRSSNRLRAMFSGRRVARAHPLQNIPAHICNARHQGESGAEFAARRQPGHKSHTAKIGRRGNNSKRCVFDVSQGGPADYATMVLNRHHVRAAAAANGATTVPPVRNAEHLKRHDVRIRFRPPDPDRAKPRPIRQPPQRDRPKAISPWPLSSPAAVPARTARLT